ncbi:MAG: DNA-protecting protein DprA, partial [Chlamydiales bacterium]|nr:DNA-protecting protein DprA [Chlamydiales bacterium]
MNPPTSKIFAVAHALAMQNTSCVHQTFQQSETWQMHLNHAFGHIKFHADKGIQLITTSDLQYPRELAKIPNPPKLLYAMGNLDLLNSRAVAIIGARKASHHGHAIAAKVSTFFSNSNITVVSGLALGIDAAAHQACVASKGSTIAVLAHGLHQITPKQNVHLAENILSNGGLLISEHPFGVEPKRHFYPKRNRIQVGLSDVSIIIEST